MTAEFLAWLKIIAHQINSDVVVGRRSNVTNDKQLDIFVVAVIMIILYHSAVVIIFFIIIIVVVVDAIALLSPV